jgi:hypothetical protein
LATVFTSSESIPHSAGDHAPVCMRQYLPHLVTARLRRTAHGGVWAPMGNLDVKFLCSPKYKGFGHINTLVFALRPYLNRALFIPRAPTSSPQTSSTIMKLALAVASFFGLTLTLVRGGESKLATSHRLRIIVMPRAVYRRDIPDLSSVCPSNNTMNITDITFQTFNISYVSSTCAFGSCNATKRATIEQRDPICSTGATCECY